MTLDEYRRQKGSAGFCGSAASLLLQRRRSQQSLDSGPAADACSLARDASGPRRSLPAGWRSPAPCQQPHHPASPPRQLLQQQLVRRAPTPRRCSGSRRGGRSTEATPLGLPADVWGAIARLIGEGALLPVALTCWEWWVFLLRIQPLVQLPYPRRMERCNRCSQPVAWCSDCPCLQRAASAASFAAVIQRCSTLSGAMAMLGPPDGVARHFVELRRDPRSGAAVARIEPEGPRGAGGRSARLGRLEQHRWSYSFGLHLVSAPFPPGDCVSGGGPAAERWAAAAAPDGGGAAPGSTPVADLAFDARYVHPLPTVQWGELVPAAILGLAEGRPVRLPDIYPDDAARDGLAVMAADVCPQMEVQQGCYLVVRRERGLRVLCP